MLQQQQQRTVATQRLPPLHKPIRRTLANIAIFISLTKKPLVFVLGFSLVASFLTFFSLVSFAVHANDLNVLVTGGSLWVEILLAATTTAFVTLVSNLRQPSTHGSARFATIAELYKASVIMPTAPQESYLPLGTSHNGFVDVGLSEKQQQSHVLLVAPTGKRKTSGIIIPGLLSEQGNRSLVINDVKGELIQKCAGALSSYHDVYLFCPTRPQTSHQYNPLMHIETLEDAQDFAYNWILNTGTSESDPFWDRVSTQLLMATVLHLRAAEPDAPLSRLADILCGMELAEIQQILTTSPSPQAQSVTKALMHSLTLNPKLGGSIAIEVSSRLFILMSADVQTATTRNDLDFNALIQMPTALFLSIPASEKDRLRPISACLMMQLMKKLTKQAEKRGGTLPRNVVFYLDEFANIGNISHFLEHISLVRSAGIAFIMAIQDFGQLKRVYGEDGFHTILANSTTQIVFPGCGPQETQHYSTLLGQETIVTMSRSTGLKGSTLSNTGRSLRTADELRTMALGNLIVVSDTMKPMLIRNRTYLQMPEMQERIGLPIPAPIAPPSKTINALPLAPSQQTQQQTPQGLPQAPLIRPVQPPQQTGPNNQIFLP
jgi:type IV secretion system protein VirD4